MLETYLDNAATTKPFEEVVNIANYVLKTCYGNPSSLHRKGVESDNIMKTARAQIAKATASEVDEVYFTSGGTEANNMAIVGSVNSNKRKGNHIITTTIEHPSVLNVYKSLEEQGFKISYINVDRYGMIDVNELANEINDKTIFVSVMHVNNEIGTIQPIQKIARLKGKHDFVFHVDDVQGFCKLPISELKNVDLISISAHKIHGIKGTGALIVKNNTKVKPIVFGGGQEKGFRSGTENVVGIAGFGTAAEQIKSGKYHDFDYVKGLRKDLKEKILSSITDCIVNEASEEFVAPNILNVSFKGVRGETLLHALEQHDIYVSTGSACSSKKESVSHVLKAINVPKDYIDGTIRISLSVLNTYEDIDYTAETLMTAVRQLRK